MVDLSLKALMKESKAIDFIEDKTAKLEAITNLLRKFKLKYDTPIKNPVYLIFAQTWEEDGELWSDDDIFEVDKEFAKIIRETVNSPDYQSREKQDVLKNFLFKIYERRPDVVRHIHDFGGSDKFIIITNKPEVS